jgi:Cft2 family RNA processing exonuclease
MKIINLNPGDEIGASAWFLELEGYRLLMDAGIHPKREGKEGMPLFDLIAKEDLDAIALSHCHHDHVGSLPVALRHFPQAHVLMTELSYFLVERVLHNSVNVMTKQRDEVGIKEYPLFTHDEVDDIAPVFQGFKYNKEIEWSQLKKVQIGLPSPTLEFYDAGHALGSAGMMIRGQKQTLFYSGDVSFRDQTILRGARFQDVKADVLILETTRGNREVPADFTREKEIDRLAQSIQKVLARKGSVLIPTFALGRTQEILAQLALLMKENKIPRQPIYIGGLGRVFTEIYDLQAHRTHRQLTNLKLTEALHLIVLDKNKAEQMKLGGGKLFVITAGMMSEQTAAHDLAMRMVGDPNQAVFFVGYADSETPGGRLKRAKQGETFVFSASGGELTRNCQVEEFDLTAHANRDELVDFVGEVSPHTVILGHGEPDARQWIENQIKIKYPKMKVVQPKPGESVIC